MDYVTFDSDGNLTGSYQQDLLPEHEANRERFDPGTLKDALEWFH